MYIVCVDIPLSISLKPAIAACYAVGSGRACVCVCYLPPGCVRLFVICVTTASFDPTYTCIIWYTYSIELNAAAVHGTFQLFY